MLAKVSWQMSIAVVEAQLRRLLDSTGESHLPSHSQRAAEWYAGARFVFLATDLDDRSPEMKQVCPVFK